MTDHDIDITARTIYGEARGQPLEGIVAVASVIMNRVAFGRYGTTPADVCLRPWQFSCWNDSDPNKHIIEAVDASNRVFADCLIVAELAVKGLLKDPTNNATHYHTRGVAPNWSKGKTPSAVIGDHLFFNDID